MQSRKDIGMRNQDDDAVHGHAGRIAHVQRPESGTAQQQPAADLHVMGIEHLHEAGTARIVQLRRAAKRNLKAGL